MYVEFYFTFLIGTRVIIRHTYFFVDRIVFRLNGLNSRFGLNVHYEAYCEGGIISFETENGIVANCFVESTLVTIAIYAYEHLLLKQLLFTQCRTGFDCPSVPI